MPTYEYECEACGLKFERAQAISEPPLLECPKCGSKVRKLISGGAGFIIKGSSQSQMKENGRACSLEQTGTTCCGREDRCGNPPCRGDS